VTDLWNERAELYRQSEAHREGPDLDLLVEWAAGARTALDVATGGGHVARRLREAGLEVVSCDPAPGMRPDVVCHAEELPFAENSFDVVACRVAPHHFADVQAAVKEMARVSNSRVLAVDNLYQDETAEKAERLRDPTHVRHYTEPEWRRFFEEAGLRIDAVELMSKPLEVAPWLQRGGCEGDAAAQVLDLLGDRVQDGWISLPRIALRGVKR
jgi:SAM-dependent methyltransferase